MANIILRGSHSLKILNIVLGLETIIALSTLTYIVESNLDELHLMNEHVFNDFIDQ